MSQPASTAVRPPATSSATCDLPRPDRRHPIGPDGHRIRGTRHQRTQTQVHHNRLGRL